MFLWHIIQNCIVLKSSLKFYKYSSVKLLILGGNIVFPIQFSYSNCNGPLLPDLS